MSHLNFISIAKRVGIELILHPLFIALYLSIPRFYLVWEGRNFEDSFHTYYQELTLDVAILLAGFGDLGQTGPHHSSLSCIKFFHDQWTSCRSRNLRLCRTHGPNGKSKRCQPTVVEILWLNSQLNKHN